MQITINGIAIEAKPGQTIFQAARDNGIFIPTLCYHDKVGAAGKCRVCVVEVEGMKGLQTSCSVEVREGMVVQTRTEKALAAQRLVVDLLLSTGTHDCIACDQNGACELQNDAYYLGIERGSLDYGLLAKDVDESSEFVFVDRNKCISCGRCVAACNGTVVNEVLDFKYRGAKADISFDNDLPMGSSSCVQCGECSQICPVGAITDKLSKGKARHFDVDKVYSVCPYCGVGCKLELHVDRKTNTIVRVRGAEGAPTNNGMLCVKGRYGYDFVAHPDRLKTPLIRNPDGSFREASWDEALDLVAKRLGDIKEKHGPDSIMGLCSAKVTNEENYAFQKFFRQAVGTNNIDHCARL